MALPDTTPLAVSTSWVEATAGLSMVDGKKYTIEFVSDMRRSSMVSVDSATNTAPTTTPATTKGHNYYPGHSERPADYRVFEKKASRYLWVAAPNGDGGIAAAWPAGTIDDPMLFLDGTPASATKGTGMLTIGSVAHDYLVTTFDLGSYDPGTVAEIRTLEDQT